MLRQWTRRLVPELSGFFDRLADLEPALRPLIAAHIRDYDELLPSLLIGDIACWAARTASDSSDSATRLGPVVARLEQEWGDGRNAVADLIAVSFVENIVGEPRLVALLGPKLSRYYRLHTGQDRVREDERRPVPPVLRDILALLGRPHRL